MLSRRSSKRELGSGMVIKFQEKCRLRLCLPTSFHGHWESSTRTDLADSATCVFNFMLYSYYLGLLLYKH